MKTFLANKNNRSPPALHVELILDARRRALARAGYTDFYIVAGRIEREAGIIAWMIL